MNTAQIYESNILENYTLLLILPYYCHHTKEMISMKIEKQTDVTEAQANNGRSKLPVSVTAMSFSSKQTEKQLFQTFRLNLPATKLSRLRTHDTFDCFLPTLRKSHDRRKKSYKPLYLPLFMTGNDILLHFAL